MVDKKNSRRRRGGKFMENMKNIDYNKAGKKALKIGDSAAKVAGSAGTALKAGFLIFIAYTVTYAADQYLGIYTWVTGSVAVADFLGYVDVSKNIYMYLAIITLAALVVLKLGNISGQTKRHRESK